MPNVVNDTPVADTPHDFFPVPVWGWVDKRDCHMFQIRLEKVLKNLTNIRPAGKQIIHSVTAVPYNINMDPFHSLSISGIWDWLARIIL